MIIYLILTSIIIILYWYVSVYYKTNIINIKYQAGDVVSHGILAWNGH